MTISAKPTATDNLQDYLSQLPPARREAIETIRALIYETLPEIKETMQYRMPTYDLDEGVCAVASQKNYMSLYMDVELIEKYKPELGGLNCGKSCIRFTKIEKLPLDVIKKILLETAAKQGK